MSIRVKTILGGVCCTALLSTSSILEGAALSKADAHFMKMAAEGSMAEAHLGQMAEAKAAQQAVKDFGQKLSTDHTTAYGSLTVLAKETGDKIPTALGEDKTIERLTHLKGKRFERAFLLDEVQSHKTTIAAFRQEAARGENADLKAWAKAMIPTLEGHLQTAEGLVKQEKISR